MSHVLVEGPGSFGHEGAVLPQRVEALAELRAHHVDDEIGRAVLQSGGGRKLLHGQSPASAHSRARTGLSTM